MGVIEVLRDTFWPSADDVEAKAAYLPVPGSPGFAAYLQEYSAKSGVAVNTGTAIQVTAVLACVKVIAEGVAQVPCKLFFDDENGAKQPAKTHPLYPLLYRFPNPRQTSFEFREQMLYYALLTGNAFALKMRDPRGRLTEILPIPPEYVRFEQQQDLSVRYWVKITDKTAEVEVPESMMWHFRGPSWNGYAGLDMVRIARNAIGLAIATESFGSEMFANGVRLSGHLEIPTTATPELIAQLKETWSAVHQGAGNRLQTALLSGGVTFKPHELKADEAQYIETRRFLIEEVCRVFRVNPVMVMHQMNNMAYASVEQLLIAHVTHTLGPWFERFEQSAEAALLTPVELQEGYSIELVEQVLVRGTAQDRVNVLATLRQNGAVTGNEMREGMDLARVNNPILDEFTPAVNLFGPRSEAVE